MTDASARLSAVYLALDLKHDRKVAIKVLRPELAAVIGANRFLSEIKTTANLQHPHILPLFDSGTGLTYTHITCMVFHMKTTLNIDDSVMARLRHEAARSGRTMSELVETALRRLLQSRRDRTVLPPLGSFDGGGALVDIADRDALYRAMEGR